MIQLITEAIVVATRARHPAVNIADRFTQDLTQPGSGGKQYTSPEAFDRHQASLWSN